MVLNQIVSEQMTAVSYSGIVLPCSAHPRSPPLYICLQLFIKMNWQLAHLPPMA